MPLKSLNSWAPGAGKRGAQESERQNHNDTGATVDNPNAQGPVMRPVPQQTAGIPNYPSDLHDTLPDPYPRRQAGATSGCFGPKTDRKDGAGGRW